MHKRKERIKVGDLTAEVSRHLLSYLIQASRSKYHFLIHKATHSGFEMGPRWKGKGSEAKALENPMSKTVSQLQSSLASSHTEGILSGNGVLVRAGPKQAELLLRSCFGRPIVTSEAEDGQWFLLDFEEAFYLSHPLRCIRISGGGEGEGRPRDAHELWGYMRGEEGEGFPALYKAYSHLRDKNWVVRPGHQYGADYVAYRHHPSFVHSEFAVLVLPDPTPAPPSARLTTWSDVHSTLRLCGSVAKELLLLRVDRRGAGDDSPSCLERYTVYERSLTRWCPEESSQKSTPDDDDDV